MHQNRLSVRKHTTVSIHRVRCRLGIALSACKTVVNPVSGRPKSPPWTRARNRKWPRAARRNPQTTFAFLTIRRCKPTSGVGMRIARDVHRPNLPWTITVLDGPEVNAFATTAAMWYITRGINGTFEQRGRALQAY